jgi:hypothetical protein
MLFVAYDDCQMSVMSAYLGIVSALRLVVLTLAPVFCMGENCISISSVCNRYIYALVPRLRDFLNFGLS